MMAKQILMKKIPAENYSYCSCNKTCPEFYNGIIACTLRQENGECLRLKTAAVEALRSICL
jgi:hypothetical protein